MVLQPIITKQNCLVYFGLQFNIMVIVFCLEIECLFWSLIFFFDFTLTNGNGENVLDCDLR